MIYIQIKNYLSELKLPTGGHILLLVSSFSIKRGESLKFMNYDGEHKLTKKSEEKSLKMWKDETWEDFSTNSRKLKSWCWAEGNGVEGVMLSQKALIQIKIEYYVMIMAPNGINWMKLKF